MALGISLGKESRSRSPAPEFTFNLPLLAALGSASFGLAGSMFSERWLLFAIGSIALLIVLLPTLHKSYRPVSPWTFLVVTVFIGFYVRGVYFLAGHPDARTLDTIFFLSQPPAYFIRPALIAICFLLFTTVAYVGVLHAKPLRGPHQASPLSRYDLDRARVYTVVAISTVVSFLAFLAYISKTGGFDPNLLSAKRTTIPDLDLSRVEGYSSFGYLQFLHRFGAIGFLLLAAFWAKRSQRFTVAQCLVLMVLFVNAALLPFYTSLRYEVALLVLLFPGLLSLYRPKFRWSLVLGYGLVALLTVQVLTTMRLNRKSSSLGEIASEAFSSPVDLLDSVVLNQNFLDLTKTAHVIHRVPADLPYKNGSTITAYLVAPIPREIWPDKPRISAGPEIGVVVYGHRVSGVPPGAVAELYWNFGLAAVPAGGLLLGALLALMERRYSRVLRSDIAILIYLLALCPFPDRTLGVSIGDGMFTALLTSIQVAAIVLGARRKTAMNRVPTPRAPLRGPSLPTVNRPGIRGGSLPWK